MFLPLLLPQSESEGTNLLENTFVDVDVLTNAQKFASQVGHLPDLAAGGAPARPPAGSRPPQPPFPSPQPRPVPAGDPCPCRHDSKREPGGGGFARLPPAAGRGADGRRGGEQVQNVLQQLGGSLQLRIPKIAPEELEKVGEDYDMLSRLEATMAEWTQALQSTIRQETDKVPKGHGPLAEIEFWRERNANISALYEQLNLDAVKAIIAAVKGAGGDSGVVTNFRAQHSELAKLHAEAKDNVKFLSTLERHFKNLRLGSLAQVLDTLQPMTNALRTVWVVSRHYSDDARMGGLMERISDELSRRIPVEVRIKELLEMNPKEALQKVDMAKNVLEQWHTVYLHVRERIEMSGRDARWEFDRKRLFEQTDYLAKVCQDLHQVVTVVDELQRLLGPELKAVTGDTQAVDNVRRRVHRMVEPVCNPSFDLFDLKAGRMWSEVFRRFLEDKTQIENVTKAFIDSSFKKLRSAEGAFELLQNFTGMTDKGVMNKQVTDKFADIVTQLSREVETTHEMFMGLERTPPISKNQPPNAGAIAWSRNLFLRTRKTMKHFEEMRDDLSLGNEASGQEVEEKYKSFAKGIMYFEKDKFVEWSHNIQNLALHFLKQPVLAKDKDGTVVVNFQEDLVLLMRETRYLDRMAFEVPDIALNTTLQEEKYYGLREKISSMLRDYNAVKSSLTPIEKELLSKRLQQLDSTLDRGFYPLNWNSLGINDFLSSCVKSIGEFGSLVNQIQKNASIIEAAVEAIAQSNIVDPKVLKGDLVDLQEFNELLEKTRNEETERLLHKYRTIAPLLGKMEELVIGTNTGKSPDLAQYYGYWEGRVFDALNKMVLRGMTTLLSMLTEGAKPLFRISANLVHPEIVLQPPVNEVTKVMGRIVRNLIECSRPFIRWMRGTCIETPKQHVAGEDEEPIVFSFFWDVSQHKSVLKFMLTLNQAIQKSVNSINRHIDSLRRYQHLWKMDKSHNIEKFMGREPTCTQFDERMYKYSKIATEIENQPSDKECHFVSINLSALQGSLVKEARLWVEGIGKAMATVDIEEVNNRKEYMRQLREGLHKDPETLEDLKFVLGIVATIRSTVGSNDMALYDLKERFRIRELYHLPDAEEQTAAALEALEGWSVLEKEAHAIEEDLEDTKETFTEITKEQVVEFSTSTSEFREKLKNEGPGVPTIDLQDGLVLLDEFEAQLAELAATKDNLIVAEKLFDLPITSYPDLVEADNEIKRQRKIYNIYEEHNKNVESFSSVLWAELDIGKLLKATKGTVELLTKVKKEVDLMPILEPVESTIVGFQNSLPLIEDLKRDALRKRHWKQLMETTGITFDMDPTTFTLGKLFAMELHNYSTIIGDIVNAAGKELTIESELQKVAEVWKEQKFELFKYMKGTEDRGWILRSAEEITLLLEDMGLNLQSMMASKFVKPFIDEVRDWEGKLSLIGESIDVWMLVQRKWMYLESIFVGSDDIRHQLPQEAKRFDNIDKAWAKIMTDTAKNTNVLDACSAQGRLEELTRLAEELESCQKSLSEYLDTKRNAFPRFFFISDDELLSILGTSDPTSVQEHMLKLFDNCAELKFGRNRVVTGMISSEKEDFNYRTNVPAEGAVEDWMTDVQNEMRSTLHLIAKEAVFNYAKSVRTQWIRQNLGMMTLVGSQIWWTWEVEDVFRRVRDGNKYAMKDFAVKLTGQLVDLTGMVRSDLSKLERKKVNQLIIIDVHARDIIDKFVRDSVLDMREFAWESQLRFNWDKPEDDILIKQCTGNFKFGYKYMGLNGRLVITALTDRCYMTITTALTYRLGGAPAGPAGTGKTETVKDLAKSMALLCVVFNCGEGLDYKAMGSIFAGLVQCGAWGCFDEFNRIDAEVLSVVSSQIKQIQEALKNDLTKFQFEGKEIACDSRTGIFITMNPGYAGRTELPDNLKALFRPVTMIVPDLEQICEIMLFSEGFDTAKVLAKKMTVLYKLSREQLSKQYHYDFGLRALKSVLVMAGSLKRGSPDLDESLVLMRALRDMNLPKFVFDDVPLFLGLINDLFPGMDCPRVRYPRLNDVVENDLAENGYKVLTDTSEQVDKVIQLYETMLTRHTTMVVGETGGGKSVIINTLARSQTKLGQKTILNILNPKAQPVSELYGVLDPETRDWTDGLLSNTFREMAKPLPPGKDELRYIIFDGDVDAVWVENMNSVMDDNKLLTLPNGERIQLKNWCKLLFEVFDLQYASPATISRCGMVYVDPKNLGYQPFLWKWCKARGREAETEILRGLLEKYVDALMLFVLEGKDGDELVTPPRQTIPITNLNMVTQLCKQIDIALVDRDELTDAATLEAIFIYAATWSCGAAILENIVVQDRTRFDKFLKSLSGLNSSDGQSVPLSNVPQKSLFDYYLDIDQKQWKAWSTLVPESGEFAKILVPTIDTVRSTWILSSQLSVGNPCLFVGEPGTAKTVTMANYYGGLDKMKYILTGMNFSSRTSSMGVQRMIESSVEKRTKDTYGPPMGKKLILLLDDLNMPKVDTYGTQQPIALLKLVIERKGLFDRGKDLNWKNMRDILFSAAMGPPGGARNPVDPRFISLFSVFEIQFPALSSLMTIYDSMLSHHAVKLDKSIQDAVHSVTESTLDLYNLIVEKLPPTPARFHYIFNLRDLSRVYEGLMQATPDVFESLAKFIRLWRHEALRIFHDRLISEEDRSIFHDGITEMIGKRFGGCMEVALAEPILYGDFLKSTDENEPRIYQDLESFDNLKALFTEQLEAYNSKFKKMNLVFFDDALEHLTRVLRTIILDHGNMLLVGVSGSGKQSLSRIAAFTAGCATFEITLARGYDETMFKEDLKDLYKMLGPDDKKVVFLFTDAQVVSEGFLELINNMLTTGTVPALYEDDEKDAMINGVRDELGNDAPDTKEACWAYFVEKCRKNLHIVLAMSPVGEDLRTRCRNFPGMVNNTVIDWFEAWPEQALKSVATAFLAEVEIPDQLREGVVDHMMMVHQDARASAVKFGEQLRRNAYVTPKNYLDFIDNYKGSLAENRTILGDLAGRLDGGLQKLIQAAKEVDQMQIELTDAKQVVDKATKECNELIEVITKSTAEVESKQEVAVAKEEQLKVESAQIAIEKEDAEAALAEAIPALEEAADALNNLKKEEITEIRAFAKPHVLVQQVGECVVILRGIKDVSWKGAKAMMADSQFLKSLINFDKDSITDKQVRGVMSYMKNKQFTPEELMQISSAGAGLLKWVFAMINYNAVAKTVNPKRQKVAAAEKSLRQASKDLAKIKDEVATLSEQLETLNTQFSEKTAEQQELKDKADTMERRLTAASKLISGLGSEQTRWTADIQELDSRKERLVGDCLLTSSFLSYAGPFNYDFRHKMTYQDWVGDVVDKKLPVTEPFRLETLLTSEVELSQWASEGLPSDELSVQNGILTTRASRYPLCIDPQMQAVSWIKKREGKNLEGKVKTFNDSDMLKQLELAIQYGFPFLFENVDEYIDPVIDPVLEKNFKPGVARKVIQLGDKEIEWDDSFRLYMTSKLSNPNYGPDVFGKTMIINYSVTQQGLQEQLLNVTVRHERPDLEEQRDLLVKEMSDNKTLLKDLEDTLLRELSNATGNILDNHELIATLEETKSKAVEISEKLEQAKLTAEEIDTVRVRYMPAAKRGAILFFVLANLSAILNMYEYSLASYLTVFNFTLNTARKDASLDSRLRNVIDALTYNVYNYTCLGLFEKHKLMLSFQMTCNVLKGENDIDLVMLDFFLKGSLSLEKNARKRPYEWFPEQGREDLMALTVLKGEEHAFATLADSIEADEAAWRTYYEYEKPEVESLPDGLTDKLDLFEQMLVLRCLRVDRVTIAVTNFVIAKMGEKYVQPPVLDYHNIYTQTTSITPVVFVLSPGADPAFDVFKLGEEMGFKPGAKLKYMALGQGMGPKAMEFVETGSTRGLWVMLQNCHLLPKWLKKLEKALEKIEASSPHKDFRLWMTTEPTDKFPLGILQRSLKVVTEPPNGLKLNMRASYSKITDEILDECPHMAFKTLVYVLGFFHAVVQERRKYGKLGWNVAYDFNETDFRISMALISTYLTKATINKDDAIPWGTLRYLIGEAMYGGRVSDSFDRRVLTTYLDEYLGDFVFDEFQPFFFFNSPQISYSVPEHGPKNVYTAGIDSFPIVQTPEVFGLNPNADISYYTSATKNMWKSLLDLQPKVGGGGTGISREEYISNVSKDIESKIPEPFDLMILEKQIPRPTPTQVVLLQEVVRWNALLVKMASSLKELSKALSGEVGFSAQLEALATSIFNGELPDMWAKLNPATEKKLGSWMLWFQKRYNQYDSWIKNGEPAVLWLSGLHIPETYLAALVQSACRSKGWALDRSTLYTQVSKQTDPAAITEKLPLGCYVSGLYLEGAGWDIQRSLLMRQEPKKLVQELPILKIIPVEASKLKLTNTFKCPVYVTQGRRNAMGKGLIFEADLATDEHVSHWVLQGVALTLNVD